MRHNKFILPFWSEHGTPEPCERYFLDRITVSFTFFRSVYDSNKSQYNSTVPNKENADVTIFTKVGIIISVGFTVHSYLANNRFGQVSSPEELLGLYH